MNVVQLIRKARLGVDALLPSGAVSSMWDDDETSDIITEAYDEIYLRFRMARKKWGLLTVQQSDPSFTRDGETYSPGLNLVVGAGVNNTPPRILLPPDFGEMVRVLCTSNRTVRFLPSQMESFHWVDMEQGSFNTTGSSVIPSTPDGLSFYWDIIGSRTMIVIPPTTDTFNIQIEYIPMKQPLFYTSAGTVQIDAGDTAVVGTGTQFMTACIFSESTSNAAELITGTNIAQDATGVVGLAKQYPRVAAINSDLSLTLVQPATVAMQGAAVQYILAMAPALPRVYHRWISRVASTLMLSKVSPQLADQYSQSIYKRFEEYIQPTAHVRQSQESVVTEDAEEFGVTSEW